ncbi:MAG: TolB family protein [Chlamydiales bacterium]|nr:TolB family protein [Chlamydiia bacterium]MCP5506814.1 TolB family protein [Chlamydiales bacterium]
MIKFLIRCALFLAAVQLCAEEEKHLSNIRQVTFSSMGFEKAGEGYFSPDEQLIIFQAVPHGEKHYQMYLMALDESIPRLVSTGKGSCTCGFFHPNDEKILFASSHEAKAAARGYKWDLTPYMNIYEANRDGSGLQRLTSGPAYHAECSYSPDGTEILYASNEDGSMNLYIMDRDGSHVRQLTATSGFYNGGPFFSPDGQHVLFRSDRQQPDMLQLYLIDRDGNNERQLTDNNAVNWAPYWHPKGSVIAYTTSVHGHHRYEIYLLNIHTGKECRLTHNDSFDGLPVFNHDGTKIMWTSQRGEGRRCHLFIADFTMPESLE